MAHKKRHHSSVKMHRMHEEHSMRDGHHRTKHGSVHSSALEGYAGMDTRERNMYRKGEFVDESHAGYADMPQQVEYKRYAETPYGLDQYLDDGIGGIDSQVKEDRDMVRKGLQPKKY
jgi:hypothetical protein